MLEEEENATRREGRAWLGKNRATVSIETRSKESFSIFSLLLYK
jgi:hypothetical protein